VPVAELGTVVQRIVVLDDLELMRRGQCSAFEEADDFELVGCASTADALAWDREWCGVDVAVVDAYDPHRTFDRFVGVEVVDHLRSLPLEQQPEVFVVGVQGGNPYLTVRLAEAGADQVYRRDELRSAADLLAAVRRPSGDRRPDPGAARLRIPGLQGPTSINRLLRLLAEDGLDRAFDPGLTQSTSGFSRRQPINVRQLVHAEAQLDAAARHRTGGRQVRGVVPTWREVVDFVNRARGAELRAPAL
jgi:DNA-binding NarL/FixJ family response regulator